MQEAEVDRNYVSFDIDSAQKLLASVRELAATYGLKFHRVPEKHISRTSANRRNLAPIEWAVDVAALTEELKGVDNALVARFPEQAHAVR